MHHYTFYYWGPLLFRTKMVAKDLKECAKLCSKQSESARGILAGVIKYEQYVNITKFHKIMEPYFVSFRDCYKHWYGTDLHKKIVTLKAWVNFMRPGEFNPPHIHTDCDLSCVLFIKVSKKIKEEHKAFLERAGAIDRSQRFDKVGPGSLSFTFGESRPFTPNRQYFFPEEGDLFIFPANLTHFVAPFLSKAERISMSANFKVG